MRIIRDVNDNGRIDIGDEIIESQSIGTNKDSITLDGLGVGTYFAEVKSVDGTSTTYDLLLDYRKGVRDFESEPNNSIIQPDFVGGNLNTTRHFRGQVSQMDEGDIFKFHVDTVSSFFANLTPDSGATGTLNMSLIRDFNSNGRIDRDELLVASSNVQDQRDVLYSNRLLPGDYFLQVYRFGGAGTATYNLDLKAQSVNTAKFEVNLERIKAIDDLEGIGRGAADFYAYMSIDGKEKMFYNNDLHGDNDISPNFRLAQDVSINNRYIPFGIRVFESDGSITADEHVDINPLKGQKDLTLTYDTLTGKVLGNELTGVYQEGDLITVSGAGDSDRGMVSFRVNYSSFLA